MTTTERLDLVESARGLRDLVRVEAAECERLRTLSPTVVGAMWDSGLMSALNPREAGGSEASLHEVIEMWIELAWQDGSVGWTAIANLPSAFFAATYLPDQGFAEAFTDNANRVTMGGHFAPVGQGVVTGDGYRLTGSWSFGSGTGHSAYVGAGFIPMENGEVRWMSEGVPELMVAILPREEINFTDGWHVQGLKGTGSYDYNLADVYVPAYRTFKLFANEPLRGGSPAGRLGTMAVTAAGHAAWALGVAKSMLDDVQELAATKFRMMDQGASLASRPTFQKGLTHHRSAWNAARLLVLDAFDQAEATAACGAAVGPHVRANVRAATVYATDVSRMCAEWTHLAAGTSAIREGTRLERAFRDIYTGTQHAFISEKVAMDCAEVWLGIVDDNFAL